MVQADYLFLMTDVDCLYDKNPRTHPNAHPIEVVRDISSLEADVSSAGSSLGTGGMSTKIVAARLATSAGVTTVIARSSNPGNIANIVKYTQAIKQSSSRTDSLSSSTTLLQEDDSTTQPVSSFQLATPKGPLHTRFLPDPHPIRDRSFWLLHGLTPHGTIYIDEGAYRALIDKAGLLPVGVVDVSGSFAQQEAVRIVVIKRILIPKPNAPFPTPEITLDTDETTTTVDAHQKPNPPSPINHIEHIEIGRALSNYAASEIARIKGLKSAEIEGVLGYADSEYVALRENISLFKKGGSESVTPRVE